MKKIAAALSIVIPLAAVNISCEEDFNPKAEIKVVYVLNAVICVAPYQATSKNNINITATVSKSFDINGYLPDSDTNTFIGGAEITLRYSNRQIKLEETIFPRLGEKCTCYVEDPYSEFIADPGGRLFLEAKLPDGTILSAETISPKEHNFSLSRAFNQGLTTDINMFKAGEALIVDWTEDYQYGLYYFPKFVIYATNLSTNKQFSVSVPMDYVKNGEKSVPLYPGVITGMSAGFKYSAIDSAMKNLSAGIPDKSLIKVTFCSIGISVFDHNLSSYYSSAKGYMDAFSIRTDNNIYSNVKGGLGIFGSWTGTGINFPVEKNYSRSFGYKSWAD